MIWHFLVGPIFECGCGEYIMYQMPRRTKLSGGISLEWVIKKEEAKISARERCEAQDVLSLLACLVWKRYNMAGGRKDWAGGAATIKSLLGPMTIRFTLSLSRSVGAETVCGLENSQGILAFLQILCWVFLELLY